MGEDPRSAATLPALFLRSIATHDGVALEHRDGAGGWASVGFAELGTRVLGIARGLVAAGVRPGDRVAIFAATRPEWMYADYAALCVGATVVPVYHTSSAEEAGHVLRHSGASVAFVEDGEPAARLASVRSDCPDLHTVLSLDGGGLDELTESGAQVDEAEIRARAAAVRPEDVSTLVYTSGTTGSPKGCRLTHANYRANTRMCAEAIDLGRNARIFVFLPFAHSMTRCTGQLALEGGHALVFFGGDIRRVLEDLAESGATHLPSVPHLFEKIHAAATRAAATQGGMRRRIFEWSIGVGASARAAEARGGRRPRLRLALADRLVLRKVRALFGGDLRLALTGAAPIEPEILRFFDACGILVLEGYGMTECAAAAAANSPSAVRFGTVGRPLAAGEILLRGPHVFAGYHDDDEATAAILADGWLHSGDLGELDADGYLTITGRKKDILITSSGKNVTPAVIENALRQIPAVAHAIVVGDRRPYLTALLQLDPDETGDSPAGELEAALARDVARVNARFAAAEQVKRFAVLPRPLAQEDGELTPTMKVKRPAVLANFGQLVEGLYGGREGVEPSRADDDAPADAPLEPAQRV